MGYSVKIHFRKDYIKADGTCSIYLQVIINRKKKLIPLDLSWPHYKCEDSQALCLPRLKEDPDVDDVNTMLRDYMSKANEIFKLFRLSGQALSMEGFLAKWQNDFSRKSFLEYYEQKMKFRLRVGDITHHTYKNYGTTLFWLKKYRQNIAFSDFDEQWAYKFDAFLKNKIKARNDDTTNSRWGYHKNIKTTLNLARRHDKIHFFDPYEFFNISPVRGNWKAIVKEDILKLYKYYRETANDTHRKVLRRFLFSIATSLRVSDLYRCEVSWKNDKVLRFVAAKGRKKNKLTEIPLSNFAQALWKDALKDANNDKLFSEIVEQYSNRVLKEIAVKLKIDSNLHHHIGRHTWTTTFLNNGGSLRAAQKILNHYSIKTTMIYDHMDFEEVKKEVSKMEFI